ncbi:MAG: hydroxyacid dehydrogenase [Candidatus Pelagibacter sp.]|nr:hydroxyacid dehydrogenase [Candidatus Pelagibacter sp.]|tara:strand:+ start:326 stop:1276 length:951 start_codon:yes stop_codon:yes gene_type:complete
MIKVAVLDDYQNIFKEFINIEKYKDKYEFKIFNKPFENEDEALLELEKIEVLFIMRERTKISKALINGIKNLKYIMTSGMRNKAIDLDECKKRKIIVCGTDINSNPTAEITWALILGLMRNMKQEVDNMFQGYWQTTIGYELKGKILGLIGLGKIGSQVAKIGKAFGMQVVAWSENLDLPKTNELGVLPISKEELLKQSDIVSIHVVLGDRYKNLIGKNEFDLMKKTSFIINTSRGPIINEKDLIQALEDDDIAGAGLDVYDTEPLPQDHKLRFIPNALLLPHLGYVTDENYSIFFNQMLENLDSCLNGSPKRLLK